MSHVTCSACLNAKHRKCHGAECACHLCGRRRAPLTKKERIRQERLMTTRIGDIQAAVAQMES